VFFLSLFLVVMASEIKIGGTKIDVIIGRIRFTLYIFLSFLYGGGRLGLMKLTSRMSGIYLIHADLFLSFQGRGKRKKGGDDEMDPLDPSYYSDAPRGKWSAGIGSSSVGGKAAGNVCVLQCTVVCCCSASSDAPCGK